MKQYLISIQATPEVTTVEVRCDQDYAFASAKGGKRFPILAIIKTVIKIHAAKLGKRRKSIGLWERYWTK